MDDWIGLGEFMFHHGGGFWGQVTSSQVYPARAPMAVASVLELEVLGTSRPHVFLAFAAVVDLAGAILFYAILRRLAFERLASVSAAVLLLVIPTADSTAFWDPEWAPNLFGRLLPFVGLLCGLRALESRRRGAQFYYKAASAISFVLATFGYELVAPAIVLAGLLYISRAPLRRAFAMWALDVGVVVVTLALKPSYETPDLHLSYILSRIATIAAHGLDVIAYGVVPLRNAPVTPIALSLAGIAALALIATFTLRRGDELRTWFVRSFAMFGFGFALAVAGWVLIIPAAPGYDPLSYGVENRTNLVADVGTVLIAFATVSLLLGILRRLFRAKLLTSSQAVAFMSIPILIGSFATFHRDQLNWRAATVDRNLVLASLHRLMPEPASGTVFFTFGEVGYLTPAIPVFGGEGDDDLWWAVKDTYHDVALAGFPVFAQTPLTCTGTSVSVAGTGVSSVTAYPHAVFVDVPQGRLVVPHNRAECLADAKLEPYATMQT